MTYKHNTECSACFDTKLHFLARVDHAVPTRPQTPELDALCPCCVR